MTEKEAVKQLKKFWKANGWYVIRNQQNIGSHKGLADFTVIKNGVVIFVEVKSDKGRQSPAQKLFEKDIVKHGGYYCVCRSVDDFLFYDNYVYDECYELEQGEDL